MIEELNGDFLQWLRGFYFVAKTGSIRRAAELMHRNPSTISYQVRSLEQELGTVLFDRYKKSLHITPEGKKLLEWAIATFETLQSMRSAVGTTSGTLQGSTTFSATLPFACQVVEPIARFREQNPNVEINIQRALPMEVVTAVQESQVDFGLLGIIKMRDDMPMEILFKSRPLLVVHRDNSWNIPPVPSMDDVRQLPFVSFLSNAAGKKDDPYFELAQSLDSCQRRTNIAVNNYHLMLHFVLQGAGVAIMDELCLQSTLFGEEWSRLVSYPLDHILPNMLYGILIRRKKHLSPQAAALIDALRVYFANLPLSQPQSTWRSVEGAAKTATKKGPSASRRPAL